MKMYYLWIEMDEGPDTATVIADSKEEACRFVVDHLNTKTDDHNPEFWRDEIEVWEDPENVTVEKIVDVSKGWCNCSYTHIC